MRANRRAALRRLETLTGHAIDPDASAQLPDLHTSVAQAREALTRERARPEYAQFDRARDRASRQQALTAAADRPQLSAFGRGGYGRPGLDFISDQPEWYGLGGVQFQWKAWNWNTSAREREALTLQQKVVDAEEAAFTERPSPRDRDRSGVDRSSRDRASSVDDRIIVAARRHRSHREGAAGREARSPRRSTSIDTRNGSRRSSSARVIAWSWRRHARAC